MKHYIISEAMILKMIQNTAIATVVMGGYVPEELAPGFLDELVKMGVLKETEATVSPMVRNIGPGVH